MSKPRPTASRLPPVFRTLVHKSAAAFLAAMVALLPISQSYAGGTFASSYITLEGTSVTVQDKLDGELNPMGLRFRLGMPIAENLDVEAHFGFGSDSRDSAYDEFSASYGGAFLKAYLPVGFNSALYALGGFSSVNLTQTVDGRDFSDDRVGFSYGAGLETRLSERADLTADFVRYVRDEGLFEDISAVSFGIKLYF